MLTTDIKETTKSTFFHHKGYRVLFIQPLHEAPYKGLFFIDTDTTLVHYKEVKEHIDMVEAVEVLTRTVGVTKDVNDIASHMSTLFPNSLHSGVVNMINQERYLA